MVGILFFLVCSTAAWRLYGTPLFGVALTLAVANGVFFAASVAYEVRREMAAPKIMVALQHVCSGLGGFLLFVSFALG